VTAARARLRVCWSDLALADLDRVATAKQAERVVLAMERMARWGWSTGRRAPSWGGNASYWAVPPLGVVYEVAGVELEIIAVVHGRQLRTLP
jgi:hypothetical protein